jgi:soluble lytic murein transglycosylase-like protein
MNTVKVLLAALVIEFGLMFIPFAYFAACNPSAFQNAGAQVPKEESALKERLIDKTMQILTENDEMTAGKKAILPAVVDSVIKHSAEYGVDPELVLSVIYAESRFDPDVISSAGAKGLMQVLNPDYDGLPDSVMFDVDRNIQMGIAEFAGYLEQYDSVMKSLYRYNGMKMKTYSKSVQISKESYYYAIRVMDIYYLYKNPQG